MLRHTRSMRFIGRAPVFQRWEVVGSEAVEAE